VLFDELSLPSGRRKKTGASTDSDVLERLIDKHPIAQRILDYRQVSKLLSTYVDALPRLVRADTGRLHTSYHQTVAATGRLSSSDPNLQNIPIRTEAGRKIRAGFIAPPGFRLLSADYSQVELRVLASISSDPGLVEAFRAGVDVHAHTAAAVFGVAPAAVTTEMRAKAKAVNFGVIYGQGARGLAAVLQIPVAEAESFISAYFERYAAVRAFKEETLERARREGYVTTLLGRRRYLPDILSPHGQRRSYAERTAVNTVIQGTAADLIKVAMVRIDRRLTTEAFASAMLLQVHDELVFEAKEEELGQLEAMVREEMSGALDLAVPIVVEMGSGRNWLEAH
jgi:DNA polymerase-1